MSCAPIPFHIVPLFNSTFQAYLEAPACTTQKVSYLLAGMEGCSSYAVSALSDIQPFDAPIGDLILRSTDGYDLSQNSSTRLLLESTEACTYTQRQGDYGVFVAINPLTDAPPPLPPPLPPSTCPPGQVVLDAPSGTNWAYVPIAEETSCNDVFAGVDTAGLLIVGDMDSECIGIGTGFINGDLIKLKPNKGYVVFDSLMDDDVVINYTPPC